MHWYQAESHFVCIVLSTINPLNNILNINFSIMVQGDMPDVHREACTIDYREYNIYAYTHSSNFGNHPLSQAAIYLGVLWLYCEPHIISIYTSSYRICVEYSRSLIHVL